MMKAATLLRNPWVLLGIAVVVLLVLWKYGTKSLLNINLPTPLPIGPALTQDEKNTVRELARRLHRDMDGPTFGFQRDADAWRMLMSMPDRLFIATYNDFNSLYYKEGEGTLREWVESEVIWWDTQGIGGRNQILERMDQLNLN